MVTGYDVSGYNRTPNAWQHRREVVSRRHGRQPGEDITDVVEWGDLAALTGDDNGLDDHGAVTGVPLADKQEALLADGRGADRVLEQVRVCQRPRRFDPLSPV